MDTHITAYSSYSLGRWLATLAVSLVLLALAYAHAQDPAWYLGFNSPSPSPLAARRPAPARQHGHRLAAGPAPALASARMGYPDRAPRPQFAR
jgi:hypothetical protein